MNMLSCLQTNRTHEYSVDYTKECIGYMDSDKISYRKVKGYNTLFAYFKEYEEGQNGQKISERALTSKLNLLIEVCSFSYAKIPEIYEGILGVPGTLQTLVPEQMSLLKIEYKVKLTTIVPTAYQNKQLSLTQWTITADNNVFIESTVPEYYDKILQEIKDRLNSNPNGKRDILVFFENLTVLEDSDGWSRAQETH
jgi:hypothetical protein